MTTIFVQIASYRDPELVPTIIDCIDKSKYPENLRFGICRQYHPLDGFDNLDQWRNDSRFKILDIECYQSKGVCWARSLTQSLYQNETYTLQLDSHHRFANGWDQILINQIENSNSNKPLITGYLGSYKANSNEDYSQPYPASKMLARRFAPPGTISFGTLPLTSNKVLTPARFASGHFLFTLGQHCYEYKYDPELYFAGEEISLSIRSYTLGYDLFHPDVFVIRHDYQTYERPKHWQDHDSGITQTNMNWHQRDVYSKQRVRQLLKEEDLGIDLLEYGLGNQRSHNDYELYAGLDFQSRRIHPDTLKGIDPPLTTNKDWTIDLWQKNIDFHLYKDFITDENCEYKFVWANDVNIVYSKTYKLHQIVGNSYWDWISFYCSIQPNRLIIQEINLNNIIKEITVDA